MAKQKIDDLAVVLSASSDQLAGDLRAAAKLLDGFKKKIDSQDAGGSALKRTSNELHAQKKAAQEATAAWRAVARAKDYGLRNAVVTGVTTAGTMLAAKAVARATGGVFDQLRESVDLAAELEKTSLAFEVMTGSAEQGAKTLNTFRQMAAETPFSQADIIGGGRQLMAGGLSPGQAVANLRMLGDVAAGTQTRLEDLTFVYSTMLAQGRLYTQDVNQFAARNIPIYEELAKVLKVNKNEVREMVEAGKVGVPEVQKAFKNLTSEGGRFANLMARQAETYAGLREQLSDAWDMLRTKLGQMIIEEMGLKEGAKDMQAFVEKIESGLPRVQRFVRFIGDLGRSVATVASQLLQAAAEAARFSEQLVGDTFPELRRGLQEFAEWVKSGAEFRIRPELVLEVVGKTGETLMRFFADVLRGIKEIGEFMRDWILVPIQRSFRGMMQLWAEMKNLVTDVPASERYSPPKWYEKDDSMIKRFKELWEEQVSVAGKVERGRIVETLEGPRRFRDLESEKKLRELDAARLEFLKVFALPPNEAQTKLYLERVVPPMPARNDVWLGDEGRFQTGIGNMERGMEIWRAMGERTKADLATKRAADESANALYALGGGALFAGQKLAKIDAEKQAIVAGAGGLAMVGRDLKAQKVLPREELAPIDLAPAGERIEPTRLPEAMLRDTEEATRLINRYTFTEESGEWMTDPLKLIQKHTEKTAQGIADLIRKLNLPVIIEPPK